MAKKLQHVWGLEIGQSSLKALRCHREGDQVVADTFDYVEYPKILSQPEADPEALVSDALKLFASRNDLRGATVAVSVPGHSGLTKFFKPPPVPVKKVADIVKYEAKQQIPYDLKEVIWDYQLMEGAQIEDGHILESEVGLFAMKREAVFRILKPYRDERIDINFVQLAPMSLYNMITYEKFANRLSEETYDPDSPHPSTVILSIGTDTSDLIVTNGFRVWQRSISIAGNQFTRQLTKELKLTFAKAEHLKKNALQADDPKLVFQAMRPVFNLLADEIQRSLNFYKNVNKKGSIDSMLLLGNTSKLPGLQQFLNKNLGFDVQVMDHFDRLEGSEVLGSQIFKDNAAAYGVVYGLCLQSLRQGPMRTNLLPRDFVIEMLIRNKKPWTVGALSLLLGGMVTYHASRGQAYSVVDPSLWKAAESAVDSMSQKSSSEISEDTRLMGEIKKYQVVGHEVSNGASRRVQTLELLKVFEGCRMKDPAHDDKSPIEVPYTARKEFYIEKEDQKYFAELADWFTEDHLELYKASVKTRRSWHAPTRVEEVVPDPSELTGPGWVIELSGYHYYNGIPGEEGVDHVQKYLIEFLENGSIEIPIINPVGIGLPEDESAEELESAIAEADSNAELAVDETAAAAEGENDGSLAQNDEAGTGEENLDGDIAADGVQPPKKLELPPGHVALRDLGFRLPIIVSQNQIEKEYKIPNPAYAARMQELARQRRQSGQAGGPGSSGPGGSSDPYSSGSSDYSLGAGYGSSPGSGYGGPGFGGSFDGSSGMPGGGGFGTGANLPKIKDEEGNDIPPFFDAPRYRFVVQFAWKPRFEPEGGSAAGGILPDEPGEGSDSSDSDDSM